MPNKTFKLHYKGKSFATVVRPPDWSFEKLQKVIKTKAGLSFPDNCYLRLGNSNGDNDEETLIYNQETLKLALDEAPDKRIEAVIEEGNPPTNAPEVGNRCIVSYYDGSTEDVKKTFSFAWNKGEDFEVDDFLDDLANEIQCKIDFENDDISIDDIDDLFESGLELFYCEGMNDDDNLSVKNSKDDVEDLMVNLNEEDEAQEVHFILKRV